MAKYHMSVFAVTCLMSIMLPIRVSADSSVMFGVEFGVTWANHETWIGSWSTEPKFGFKAGLFARWFSQNDIGLVTALHYAQKGTELRQTSSAIFLPEGREPMSVRLHYISLCSLIDSRVPFKALDAHFLAGPRVDWLIDKRITQSTDWKARIYDDFHDLVFGISVGFALSMRGGVLSSTLIQLAYNYDLTNSFDSAPYYTELKNKSIDVVLGISY